MRKINQIKTFAVAVALSLITVSSFAETAKDSLKAEWKPYLDEVVTLVESATGKTTLYGIPYSFIEGIVLMIAVGIYLAIHKKTLKEQAAAHKETVSKIVDAHAKTLETLTKK